MSTEHVSIPSPPPGMAPRRPLPPNSSNSTSGEDSNLLSAGDPTTSQSTLSKSHNMQNATNKLVSNGPQHRAPRPPKTKNPVSQTSISTSLGDQQLGGAVPTPPTYPKSASLSSPTPPSSMTGANTRNRSSHPALTHTTNSSVSSHNLSTSTLTSPLASPLTSPISSPLSSFSVEKPASPMTRTRTAPSIAVAMPSPADLENYFRIKPIESILDIFSRDRVEEVQKLSEIVTEIYSLRAQIVERNKHNFSLERHISQLDSKIQLLLQNQVRGTDREKQSFFTKIFGAQTKDKNEVSLQEQYRLQKHQRVLLEELFYVLRNRPKLVALLSQFVTKDNNPAVQTFSQFIVYELYGDQYDEREENLLLEIFSFGLEWEFRQCTDRNSLMRGNSILTNMLTSFAKRGQGLATLKSVLQKTVSTIYRSPDLNFEFHPDNVYREWCKEHGKPSVILKSEALMKYFGSAETEDVSKDANRRITISTEGEHGGMDIELPRDVIKTIYDRRNSLLQHTNDILEAMYASASKLPRGVRTVCRTMVDLLKTHFPGITESAICTLVGGFICLRFFCPAIINSTVLGLEPSKSSITRRNLINITKLIQCISNGSYRDNDAHMRFCDDFISKHVPRMQSFIQEVVMVEDVKNSLVLSHFLEHADNRENLLKTSLGTIHFMHSLLRQNLSKFEDLVRQASDIQRQSRIIDTQGAFGQLNRSNGGRNSVRMSNNIHLNASSRPGTAIQAMNSSGPGKLAAISENNNKPGSLRTRAGPHKTSLSATSGTSAPSRPKFFRRESVLGGSSGMGMGMDASHSDEEEDDVFNEEALAMDLDCDCDCTCSCSGPCECLCDCGCECGYGFDDDDDEDENQHVIFSDRSLSLSQTTISEDGYASNQILRNPASSIIGKPETELRKHLVRNRTKMLSTHESEADDSAGSWSDTGYSNSDLEVSVYRPPVASNSGVNSFRDGSSQNSFKRKNRVLSKSGVVELLELMELLKPSTVPDDATIRSLMNVPVSLRLADPSLREKKSPAEVERQNKDSLLEGEAMNDHAQAREDDATARRERQLRVMEKEAIMKRNAVEQSTVANASLSDIPRRGRSHATSTPRKPEKKGIFSIFRKDKKEDDMSPPSSVSGISNEPTPSLSDSDTSTTARTISSSMSTSMEKSSVAGPIEAAANISSSGFASDTLIYAKLLALLPLLPHPTLIQGLYTPNSQSHATMVAAASRLSMHNASFSTPRAPPSACLFFKYLRLCVPYLRRTKDPRWDPESALAKSSAGLFDCNMLPSVRVRELIFLLRALSISRDSGISLRAVPEDDVPFYGPDGIPKGKLSSKSDQDVEVGVVDATDLEDWVYIRMANVGFMELRVAGWVQRWSGEALIRDTLLRDTSSTLAKVRETLNVLEAHTKRLDDRLDMYEIYIESCRRGGSQSIVQPGLSDRPLMQNQKGSDRSSNVGATKQFHPRIQRFSHNDLVSWKVIAKTRTPVNPSKLRHVSYIVTEIAAGQFTIMASFAKPLDFRILPKPVVLDLEDLLIREEEARLAYQLRDTTDAKTPHAKPVSLYELDYSLVIDVCRFLHKVVRKYFTI